MNENVTQVHDDPTHDPHETDRAPLLRPPTAAQPRTRRMGTLQSATFNIWSTMVGGGSLSLPLAFAKTGNLFLGPIVIIMTAIMTEFCFGILIDATYLIWYHDQQQQQQQQPYSIPTMVAPPSETGNPSVSQPHRGDVIEEGEPIETTMTTPPEPPPPPPLEEEEHNRHDDYYCSHYTLESITAVAATAVAAATNSDPEEEPDDRTNHVTTTTATSHQERNKLFNANMAYSISALLVFFMCFFGIIGYCVLLRDMLLPVTKYIQQHTVWSHHHSSDRSIGTTFATLSTNAEMVVVSSTNATAATTVTWANNLSMMVVVFMVTPLCTLQTLTSLQKFSTLSMVSVLILGLCIVYRSVQCHLGYYHNPAHGNIDNTTNATTAFSEVPVATFYNDSELSNDAGSTGRGFTWLPQNFKDVLDVLPLYISCYVCHYNIPVVYNDFTNPTPSRVRLWLHITVWGATIFYCIVGIAGSSFALVCGSNDHIVQGNVLLNFDPDDPLLLVGRLCLAVTIALAFPVLTIPARDIILRYMVSSSSASASTATTIASEAQNIRNSITSDDNNRNMLTVPLLHSPSNEDEMVDEDATVHTSNVIPPHDSSGGTHEVLSSLLQRLFVSICVLWSGTSIASSVSSIDIVWDFLGSSLSIILSYLVPVLHYFATSL